MKLDNIIIRKINKNEIDQLVDLCEAHAEYEEASYDRTNQVERLTHYIFQENHPVLNCMVAVVDTKLIGYITFTKEFSTWSTCFYYHMDCLYLREEARKIGLGKRLMESMTDVAKQEGINHIQWQTPISNHNAIEFYTHLGASSKEKIRFFLDL